MWRFLPVQLRRVLEQDSFERRPAPAGFIYCSIRCHSKCTQRNIARWGIVVKVLRGTIYFYMFLDMQELRKRLIKSNDTPWFRLKLTRHNKINGTSHTLKLALCIISKEFPATLFGERNSKLYSMLLKKCTWKVFLSCSEYILVV